MTATYPAFLRLAGRRCIVIGGGAVAARKARGLVAAGADVLLVAPKTTGAVDQLEQDGDLAVERRAYRRGDLDGAFLVVAATDSRTVNGAVVAEARSVGALVNVVDDPAACDLIVPATVRRGDVTLAISTDGRSPSFARHLREELEAWLTEERLTLFDLIAEVRGELRAAGANPSPERWRAALQSDVLAAVRAGDRATARHLLLAALADGIPHVRSVLRFPPTASPLPSSQATSRRHL